MVNKKWIIRGILAMLAISLLFLVTIIIKKGNIPAIIKQDSASVSGLLAQAKNFESKGDTLDAKAIYQKLLNDFSNSAEVNNWQKKTEDLNIKLLFSPTITPHSIFYEIKPGDALAKIAKEYKTTPELIKRSNRLSDNKIFPGRKIKVWISLFNILIDKSQNTLMLKTNEEIIKTYTVSTGTNNSTPVGTFKITNKLINPTWFKAGAAIPASSPDNVLGSRWLGFNMAGYGIHGTIDPESLGKQATQGCVRMSNSDAEELYDIIPVGTEVTVVD